MCKPKIIQYCWQASLTNVGYKRSPTRGTESLLEAWIRPNDDAVNDTIAAAYIQASVGTRRVMWS